MARATKSDVSQHIARLNRTQPEEFSFNCWGADGTNRYQLIDSEGETYSPVCMGAREFLLWLKGFKEGRRL